MIHALPLYPFQRQALDALRARWKGGGSRYAVVLPTGSGKTKCFAHLALEHLAEHPGQRVLVLVHTDELVNQAHGAIVGAAPHLDVGIVKAERNDVMAHVIVASMQTLAKPARRAAIHGVGLVVVDECHHVLSPTYMAILTHFGCFDASTLTAGFTATLVRGDGKSLGHVWQDVAFERDISWMVRRGYLIPPRGKAVRVPDLDLRAVKSTRSDYREGELGAALAESLAPELVAKAYLEHAANRRGMLFAPTVASAQAFADAFASAGIKSEVVHGGMPLGERRAVLERHRTGAIQVIHNCMILTEGYDDPKVSCVVIARPTKSRGLYIQMAGRGLRVDPDPAIPYQEQDCLLLDVSGMGAANDLRSVTDLSTRPLPKEGTDGKTLIDLEDEFDAGMGVELDATVHYAGPVEVTDFDPLAKRSKAAWLKSAGGAYFMSAGTEMYVFIMEYPGPGQWSVSWCTRNPAARRHVCGPDGEEVPRPVCRCGKGCPGRPQGMTVHRGLPLDEAMVWAEDLTMDMGGGARVLMSKQASWRRKPASRALMSKARSLGLDPKADERMGALFDQVDRIIGAKRIDPLVRTAEGRVDA